MSVKYKRIVLKLSGEMLAGKNQGGLDSGTLLYIAKEIKQVKALGTQIAIVLGGGNIWRGGKNNIPSIDRVTSDYMGMLATTINSLALQSVLEKQGVVTRVQSAIEIKKVCEPFILRRALRHLEKGRVLIFASGTGNPYFTTDTTASLRAIEIGADIFFKATKVDGVYSDDPEINKKAKKYSSLTFMDAIKNRLKVMDTTAFSLCMENSLKVLVFDLHKAGNIKKAVLGNKIGTIIH